MPHLLKNDEKPSERGVVVEVLYGEGFSRCSSLRQLISTGDMKTPVARIFLENKRQVAKRKVVEGERVKEVDPVNWCKVGFLFLTAVPAADDTAESKRQLDAESKRLLDLALASSRSSSD